jgi:hypothetical protein
VLAKNGYFGISPSLLRPDNSTAKARRPSRRFLPLRLASVVDQRVGERKVQGYFFLQRLGHVGMPAFKFHYAVVESARTSVGFQVASIATHAARM